MTANEMELVNIYILYIRSVLEYCSVVWHSTLTEEQTQTIERVQKTCLKIKLGQAYQNYQQALEYCGLESLAERRVFDPSSSQQNDSTKS